MATPEERAMALRRLRGLHEAFDSQDDVLDELVHQVKSQEASAINNAGFEEQVTYLLDAGVGELEIGRALSAKEV